MLIVWDLKLTGMASGASSVAVLLLVWSSMAAALPQNVTTILIQNPACQNVSDFAYLLMRTGVAEQINNLQMATLFLPLNGDSTREFVKELDSLSPPMGLFEVLGRFHVVDIYTDLTNLHQMGEYRLETLFRRRVLHIQMDKDGDPFISNETGTSQPSYIISNAFRAPWTLSIFEVGTMLDPFVQGSDRELPYYRSSSACTSLSFAAASSLIMAAALWFVLKL